MHYPSLKILESGDKSWIKKLCFFISICLLFFITFHKGLYFEIKSVKAQETLAEIGTTEFPHHTEQGDALSQYERGVEYFVQQDYLRAKEWFQKSAIQGNTNALTLLGTMYQNGMGVTQDYDQAITLFEIAESKGSMGAKANLGLMYSEGEGVKKDYSKAIQFLLPAASAGEWSAQFTLGAMYADGRGVPQNYVEAHKWFNILASIGFEDAIVSRDGVAKKMTPDQIAEAQNLAKEWKENQRKPISEISRESGLLLKN